MEPYIQISKINDFIFCPKSLYLHSIYDCFTFKIYHRSAQIKGKIKHENIDTQKYSTAKKYLQGLEIYSEKYTLAGKIDVYDKEKKILIERKNKIKKIYDGYRYQLYAQYFCMIEMGYEVENLFLHSLSDNKRYEVGLPNDQEVGEFEKVIKQIKNFDLTKDSFDRNPAKCAQCVYRELCD